MSTESSRPVNDACLQLIMTSEGFEPVPKPCPAGKPTVGYGHVVRSGESFPRPLSPEAGLALLHHDLEGMREAVTGLVRVPLNDDQYAALVSFAFNVGQTALAQSTLLKRLNAGDYAGAAQEFLRWDKITVTDKVSGEKSKQALPGLAARRARERELFLGAGAPDSVSA